MTQVYLNGDFLPIEEACVSVLDRGFTFGDGVYEMIPVFEGKYLRLAEHLERLNNSLSHIYMKNPHTIDEWKGIFCELLKNNSGKNQSLYIQITRGVGDRDHVYGEELKPTVFVLCRPIIGRDLGAGASAITHEDIRWKYCYIKAISLLPSIILKQRASAADSSMEAILIKDGFVTEGAASNIFIVKDKVIKTPEKDRSLLPGITRDLLIELLNESDLSCKEVSVSEKELKEADEIWITSSTIGIVPIIKLDGENVGIGMPGEVWRQVNALYAAFKSNDQQVTG